MITFNRKRALVVGDFMLDLYTLGDVFRISPEAPVPVLRVTEESQRPGGAGNATLNLISLGMEVRVLGRVGEDEGGALLKKLLVDEKVDVSGIFSDASFRTPLKNRMIAQGQQIVRIDYEKPSPMKSALEIAILEKIPKYLENIDVVAISDYAKGFLTQAVLSAIISLSKSRKIPVIVDPKGMDFYRYRGATILKPNLGEAIAAAGLHGEASLEEVAERLLQKIECETLMVTRSKEGISIFRREEKRQDFPANVHEVKDVTGAGDTVLAVIAASVANEISLPNAAKLANIAAGKAIERIGCARISLDELAPYLINLY